MFIRAESTYSDLALFVDNNGALKTYFEFQFGKGYHGWFTFFEILSKPETDTFMLVIFSKTIIDRFFGVTF